MNRTPVVLSSLWLGLTVMAVAQTTPSTSGTVNKAIKFVLAQDLIKITTAEGKTTEQVILAPKTVLPNDILREEVNVTNISGQVLNGVLVGIPVPKGTEFSGQATPSNERWKLLYSIDGGKSYSATPTRTVTVTENGKSVTKQVAAPTNTYTHVRWTLATLKKDESLKLSFRVKVK
ncbi:hypothetical protein [Deinococcus aquatilis]|uniref:hypothetical protein n=1 Tax=Deinococcus aquatilis TaxID=519440 RepID=UPI000371FBAF|nr:hypothetical protein [Deinococcus aquatilis]